MKTSLVIEFHHSTSPRFRFILAEAQKHFFFRQEGKRYTVTFPDILLAHPLVELLKGMRQNRVFINGKEKLWDEVFCYLPCYTLRAHAHEPLQHCMGDARQFPALNPWRCIHAMMPLTCHTEWLCYGRFDLDGTFIFDKEKIKHYLITNTHKYRFCPALRIDIMLMVLEAFPETVNPRIDRDWTYAKPISRDLSVGISSISEPEHYAGVAPASPQAAHTIYARILSKFE